MKNAINTLIAALCLLMIASCGSKEKNYANKSVLEMNLPEPESSGLVTTKDAVSEEKTEASGQTIEQSAADPLPVQSKLIYTGNINMQVKKYEEARSSLDKIVKAQGAYVSNEAERSDDFYVSNTIVIRVPSAKFDKLVSDAGAIAEVIESKTTSTEDVTAQYVDVQARLKAKREVEITYLELLKRAGQISDILEIQEKLRVIREEIESAEGQLRYWDNQVSWSTLTIYMHEKDRSQMAAPGFFGKLVKSLSNGWNGLLEVVLLVTTVWPLWIILVLFVIGLRWIIRRLTKSK